MSKNSGISIILIVVIILASVVLLYLFASLLIKIKAFCSLKYCPEQNQAPELIKKKAFVTSDGYHLKWYGEIKPTTKTIILGIHDFAFSGQTFDSLATKLAQQLPNLALVSFDQRNMGKNIIQEAKNRNTTATLSDLDEILTYLRETYPDQKVYLYGAGFGANLAVVLMKKRGFLVDGVILDSMVNFKPYQGSPAMKRTLISGTLFSYTKIVRVPLSIEDYSQTADQTTLLDQSLETFAQITVKEYFQSKKIIKTSLKAASMLARPVLMGQGEKDPFQISSRTNEFFNQIIYPEKVFVSFPTKKHDLMLNPPTEFVLELCRWIEDHDFKKQP